ncbi:MAG TPA: aspartate/glutamate racemase family protein [Anaerolineales bacterium]|nr:aspartate/glutamate racemase family protein [Anaerolineales bacterium]
MSEARQILLDPFALFESYLRVTGVAHLGRESEGAPELLGKRLGLLNGSSWIALWSNFFGRRYLPGAQLVNAGNDAVQLNFMEAHARGEFYPPAANVRAFVRYAKDLAVLGRVDAILITCSTMNRAYRAVQAALASKGVPVFQIDQPMLEQAARLGGTVLILATHGPTVSSTRSLLEETASRLRQKVVIQERSLPEAWDRLARGDVAGHNECLARAIRDSVERQALSSVVLAQLSMSSILLSYPEPEIEFGLPVLTSGKSGFEHVRHFLAQ